MKRIITLLFTVFALAITYVYGQVADGITYQAVALDENGKEIAGHDINGNIVHSKQIGVRFSILSGTDNGEVLYTEEHTTYTDQFGLFTLVIGHGDVLAGGTYQKLTDINWGADKLFLKVEIDTKRSGTFKVMGIQQMMAVPFAFHALTSSSTTINYDDIVNKPTFPTVAISGYYNDLLNIPSFSTVATSGNYNDLLNRPTLFSGNYNDLTNKPVIPAKVSELTNDAGYITNPNDADPDPTNEIQTLSLEGSTLSISKGNSINLPTSSNGTPSTDYSFKSLYFPQGINHHIVSLHQTVVTSLTVPSGKTMYVLYGGSDFSAIIGGVSRGVFAPNYLPTELASPIFPSNTIVSYRYDLTYFLADNDPNIEAVNFYLNNNTSDTYTVPSAKKLVIKSLSNLGEIKIGDWSYQVGTQTAYNMIIPSNTIISSPAGVTVTGYLIDDITEDSSAGTVTDVDNNVYSTVQIGTQTWMGENLKTSKFKDGTTIPLVTNQTTWENLKTSGMCFYNNEELTYKPIYGALYNYYAVVDPRGLCPDGWHVPNDDEWKTMEMYLGMSQAEADKNLTFRGTTEGGEIKEVGTTHWLSPNLGAINSSGFTALPAGYRYSVGFYDINRWAIFWTSTGYGTDESYDRGLNYNYEKIDRHYYGKLAGLSVRCIKN